METTFAMKVAFFDREKVKQAIGAANARMLNRAGGAIRLTWRRSIRSGGKKGKASQPGEPPRYHSVEPNLRTILYAFDSSSNSMVIGPAKLNSRRRLDGITIDTTVPALIDRGGKLTITELHIRGTRENPGGWIRAAEWTKKRFPNCRRRTITRVLAPRPAAEPALMKNLNKIPSYFTIR